MLVGAPRDWTVPDPPAGVRTSRRRADAASAAVVVGFVRAAAELDGLVPDLAAVLAPGGALWVAWPRRAAGHTSDVTDDLVRHAGLGTGLVDVKVAALGDDWSGLRFVHRRRLDGPPSLPHGDGPLPGRRRNRRC